MALEKTGLTFKAEAPPQTLKDILEYAQQKFNLPFTMRSSICDGKEYMEKLVQTQECFVMGNTEHLLRVSSCIIGQIVACSLEDQICCKESEDSHQRFDPKTGVRSVLGNSGSTNIVRDQLQTLFGQTSFLGWKDWKKEHSRPKLPQAPFADASWIGSSLKKAVFNDLSSTHKTQLDGDHSIDKLLFRDGQVYDFATQKVTRVTIQDNLRRMCKVPLPPPLATGAAALLHELWDYATEFFQQCNAKRINADLMEPGEDDWEELTVARQMTMVAFRRSKEIFPC